MNLKTVAHTLAAVCALAGAARAEDVPKAHYPSSLVERPMILPRLMFEPQLDVEITNTNSQNNGGIVSPGGVGETFGFGLDVGLARRLQAGVFFAIPLHPVADFGDFVANLQANLVPHALNFRFDIGAERIAGNSGHIDSFIFGLGLPYKAKLARYFAFIGGSTRARGFGYPLLTASPTSGVFSGAALFSNDVFTLQVFCAPVGTGGGCVNVVEGALHLPFGVLIQPHPIVSFAVRTGYRLVFQTASFGGASTSVTEHFVPLAFDLTFCIARIIDLGFTAFLHGFITGSGTGAGGININIRGGYADLQRYDVWMALRF
jgi:hypothetical protein